MGGGARPVILFGRSRQETKKSNDAGGDMKSVAIGLAAGLSILVVAYSINRIAPVGTTSVKTVTQSAAQTKPAEFPRVPVDRVRNVSRCNNEERSLGRCL
jgi:hypothetical protein